MEESKKVLNWQIRCTVFSLGMWAGALQKWGKSAKFEPYGQFYVNGTGDPIFPPLQSLKMLWLTLFLVIMRFWA